MIGGSGGKAVARRFFHAEDPADVVDRAVRVGGPLTTPEDLLNREAALDAFLRTADPHFDYQTTRRPRSDEHLAVPPNTAMRLEFGAADRQLIVDALPRTEAAMELYGPRITAAFADPARAAELTGKVQQLGGRATLGDATVEFDRIPAPFDRLLSKLDGIITVRAQREPEPWPARIVVETTEGTETLDFDLEPGEPGRDFDARLAGSRNGLMMELNFVWNHDDGRGSLQLNWRVSGAGGAVEERAHLELHRGLAWRGRSDVRRPRGEPANSHRGHRGPPDVARPPRIARTSTATSRRSRRSPAPPSVRRRTSSPETRPTTSATSPTS